MNFRGGVDSEQDLEGPPKERLLIPSPAKEVSILKRGNAFHFDFGRSY
jgi:hypothetical protein